VVLLLGSNIGNTLENIQNAIAKIENRIGKIDKFSKILETKPVEFVSNNIFRNIAMSLYTTISPFSLLKEIKNIEKEMGG
jgi:2-amino-4-hydroxy-6-hydroxymethyldihydropteridine diphosphokinase